MNCKLQYRRRHQAGRQALNGMGGTCLTGHSAAVSDQNWKHVRQRNVMPLSTGQPASAVTPALSARRRTGLRPRS
jgi:hypothetical protein